MFLQSSQPVGTYYAAANPELLQPRAQLPDALEVEVLVIGAGFSGLHTALQLAEGGRQVCVIEASRIAWAASGRNGGQALPGWSSDLGPIEADLGHEGALRLWQGMLWAAREMRDLPQRHGFCLAAPPALPRRQDPLHLQTAAQHTVQGAKRASLAPVVITGGSSRQQGRTLRRQQRSAGLRLALCRLQRCC